jgi:hypothetical protein
MNIGLPVSNRIKVEFDAFATIQWTGENLEAVKSFMDEKIVPMVYSEGNYMVLTGGEIEVYYDSKKVGNMRLGDWLYCVRDADPF